ncbi:unnamed protein product [Calypogeia fissa]
MFIDNYPATLRYNSPAYLPSTLFTNDSRPPRSPRQIPSLTSTYLPRSGLLTATGAKEQQVEGLVNVLRRFDVEHYLITWH